MLKIILTAAVFSAPAIIVPLILKKIQKRTKEKQLFNQNGNYGECYISTFPKLYKMIVLFVGILFILLPFLFLLQSEEDFLIGIIVCPIFWIPSIIIFLCWQAWKIEIYKEFFIYRNWFWKSRKYYYREIKVKLNKYGTKHIIYFGEKKVLTLGGVCYNEDKIITLYKKISQRS